MDDDIDEALKIAIEKGFSRIPVYEDTLDNVVGVLYAKDLLMLIGQGGSSPSTIRALMRSALYVPESTRCRDLFRQFQQKKVQIAIVVDEYGGTSGMVTMEDLLESIVGEIQDEYDEEEDTVTQVSESVYTIDGAADLEEVQRFLPLEVPEEADYDTLSGLLTDALGRIPLRESIRKSYYPASALLLWRWMNGESAESKPSFCPSRRNRKKNKAKRCKARIIRIRAFSIQNIFLLPRRFFGAQRLVFLPQKGIADVIQHLPVKPGRAPAQRSLIMKAAFFNNPAGSVIERIMVNRHHFQTQRFKRIAQHRPDCLGHQAFAPMLLAQSITEHSAVGIVPALLLMQPNGADDRREQRSTIAHTSPASINWRKTPRETVLSA